MKHEFFGFKPEAYMFLTELGFNNNRMWMEENRERYREYVQRPMRHLAELLLPTALEIDPGFNPRLGCIVSRINRDTRYSKNKLPYRDHMWIAYRREGQRLGESLCIYFEISPMGYSYGTGMYSTNLPLMKALRARAAADPEGFRQIVTDPALARYKAEGETYKRDAAPGMPEDLKPYLNRRSLSFCYDNPSLAPTMNGGIADEVKKAMLELAPVYRYILGM
ncbi:MAG: DUF2461 domain-containing protein [Clostridia bacterium]|nr:DUF2461 domain-containing protein [Clostridia bacterium]